MKNKLKLSTTPVFTRNYNAFNNKHIRFLINQGGARCHLAGTKIRMFDGTLSNVEDIKVGDKTMSICGTTYNTVQSIHTGVEMMYTIKHNRSGFKDYVVTGNHVLALKQTRKRKITGYEQKLIKKDNYTPDLSYSDDWVFMTVLEYMALSKNKKLLYSEIMMGYNEYILTPRKRIIKDRKTELYSAKISVEEYGIDTYYGFELDGDKLYKLDSGIVQHNSSKTYSILQLIIWYALTTNNRNISIVRKTLTALKASVYVDVIEILHSLNIYDFVKENKSERTIKFPNGTTIRFFSVDDSQKLRGRKHDVVYMNEANELTYEEFMQFNIRTHSKIIIDWNPSDPYSWIHDLERNEKAIKIHSTYKDNPFLSKEIVREIENLIDIDETYYQIYTLGQTPKLQEIVFPKYTLTPFPETDGYVYGLDFGFNDPTALIKVFKQDNDLYLKQELYESYLTSEDIVNKFKALGVSKYHTIYADGSRPDQILTLNNAGYTVVKANKAIKEGLDFMKIHNIHLDPSSKELIREFNVYSFKKYKEMILDVPVDLMNHGIDGGRYGSMSFKNPFSTSFMVG